MTVHLKQKILRTKVFARVGELIQGKLSPHEHFIIPGLITNDFYTETFIEVVPVGEELKPLVKRAVNLFYLFLKGVSIDELRIMLPDRVKDADVFESDLFITQTSNIPFGKGFSSKSADCLSALKAVNFLEKSNVSNEDLYAITSMCTVVDPCLETEIAQIFDPILGRRIFHLPEVVIEGLFFDTCDVDVKNPTHLYDSLEYSELEMEQFTYLMDFYQQGLIINDLSPIFEATWKSAQINERFNRKDSLGLLKEFADSQEVGVFVSHVGSFAGIYGRPHVIRKIRNAFEEFVQTKWKSKVYSASNLPDSVGV